MRKFLKFIPVAVFATMAMIVSSCSNDNDEPASGEETIKVDPKTVFTQGVPKKVGDMVITTDANGLVTKIVDGDEVTTFSYEGAGSRANVSIPTNYDMSFAVKSTDPNDDDETYTFYVNLNEQGFIKYAYEVNTETGQSPEVEEWWFEYNDLGQMTKMKRTEGDNEVTTITYDANGDITKVTVIDDTNYTMTCTIGYGSSLTPNKSGIMLYDMVYRIDMDEMAVAYFAGLLGKGTTNLPASAVEVSPYETRNFTYTWALNSNQMPTKCTRTEGSYSKSVDLEW